MRRPGPPLSRTPTVAWVALCLAVGGCGSRTGLLVDDELLTADAGDDSGDDSGDADTPVTRDASRNDGTADARRDVAPDTADALPPIDSMRPLDAVRSDCTDPSGTLVYLVSDRNQLLSYFPTAGTFRSIGTIACPSPGGATPFSMAVDRKGIAYVVFNDGNLYRVSTKTAACATTPFRARGAAESFHRFGMGYATDVGGPSERLFIADTDGSFSLAVIDTTTFTLKVVAPFKPKLSGAELTGTGDGRLFAFTKNDVGPAFGSRVLEIDKVTARVIAGNDLPSISQGTAWAFAHWGGDFYLFTAPDRSGTVVTRFRPSDRSTSKVATTGHVIVGAGVSTCAPDR